MVISMKKRSKKYYLWEKAAAGLESFVEGGFQANLRAMLHVYSSLMYKGVRF